MLAERAALRLQVAALAAERDFVQGKLDIGSRYVGHVA